MLGLPKMTWMPDINIASGGGGGRKYVIFTVYCLYVPRVLARVVVVIKDYECVLRLWYNLHSCMYVAEIIIFANSWKFTDTKVPALRNLNLVKTRDNRPFPSSLVPLFQSESKCETILMKMTLICMKMKLHAELIFIRKVSHLDSFWNRGTRELGNGLLGPRLTICIWFCLLLISWFRKETNLFWDFTIQSWILKHTLSSPYFTTCLVPPLKKYNPLIA